MLSWLFAVLTALVQKSQQVRRSSLLPLLLPFLAPIALGTLVYAWLESWTVLDALYATIITMTTVGYGDKVDPHKVSLEIGSPLLLFCP
jgi:voltage-gated potassium channel